MRTRTDGGADPNQIATGVAYTASGNCEDPERVVLSNSNAWSHSYCPHSWSRVMHDTVTPNFRLRMAKGEIINNAMDWTEIHTYMEPIKGWYEARRLYGTAHCTYGDTPIANVGGRWTGEKGPQLLTANLSSPSFLSAPAVSEDNVKAQAITGAWAKTSLEDVQGLVVIAEAEKTIQSFASLARRAINIGRALKRGDAGGLWKQLSCKELENRWMEGRYAIRPFVYDVFNIIEAINHSRSNEYMRLTFRKRASDTATATQSSVVTYTYSNYWSVLSTKSTTVTIQARAGVLAYLKELSDASIWGLNRPWDAVWELIPFSFVVDWFFNVSKVIASWAPAYGLEPLASWVVVEKTTEERISFQECRLGTWYAPNIWENACRASGGVIYRTTHTKYRVPNPQRPILPVWHPRLNGAKLLDLVIWGKRLFA